MTALRYITEVLEVHVVPYARNLGEGFLLMQDNAPCHNARVTKNFLNGANIPVMDWPALSPDLNPI